MTELITNLLKNLGCSHCQEFEFQENNKENYKDWKLYLKEYEMYSAMVLYNSKLKKDISYLINRNENIILLNKDNNEIFLKLEFIINDEYNNSILVPTDEYLDMYEKIEQLDKDFDKEINAYYIGNYNVKKC